MSVKTFEVLVNRMYDSIPKKDREEDTKYKLINMLLQTEYGKSLENLTLNEIGNILGVTRERVRQIESEALRKLKIPHNGKRLRALEEYQIDRDTKPYIEMDFKKD